MKFKKKPVVIDAVQYNGDNKSEIIAFTDGKARTNTCYGHLTIPTIEGNLRADVGDWIVRDMNGKFYPIEPDVFERNYEEVHDL